jgi:hypothetical protein
MADFPVKSEEEVLAAIAHLRKEARKEYIHKNKRNGHEKTVALSKTKLCGGPCQLAKTLDNFDRDRSKPGGYKSWCKECRKKRDASEGEDVIARAVNELDMELLARVAGAPIGGSNMPHQVKLMETILARLGGVEGMATLAVANMLAAPPGSQQRERFLSKVISLVQACSGDGKVSKPRELMSDEELKADTDKRMERLGLVVDAINVREAS